MNTLDNGEPIKSKRRKPNMTAILKQIEEKIAELEQLRIEERLRTEEEIKKRFLKFNGESLKMKSLGISC